MLLLRRALSSRVDHRFVDTLTLRVRGGRGGLGAVAFARSRSRKKPAGGSGGNGGSVSIVASSAVDALDPKVRHVAGARGGDGGPEMRKGVNGAEREVLVPLGTVVTDEAGARTDLLEDGARVLVATGGRGGRGNGVGGSSAAALRGHAPAAEGDDRAVDLELKLVADVALVGFPNAGKSSLLRALSNAAPEVAAYAFTTIRPQIGIVAFARGGTGAASRVRLLDVPGLVEGASEGRGMGAEFLRHAERTGALLHVVDGSAADPVAALDAIRAEVAAYSPALAAKPYRVVLNKVDLLGGDAAAASLEALAAACGRGRVSAASAASGAGLPALAAGLRGLLPD